jgi:hypothetical protein
MPPICNLYNLYIYLYYLLPSAIYVTTYLYAHIFANYPQRLCLGFTTVDWIFSKKVPRTHIHARLHKYRYIYTGHIIFIKLLYLHVGTVLFTPSDWPMLTVLLLQMRSAQTPGLAKFHALHLIKLVSSSSPVFNSILLSFLICEIKRFLHNTIVRSLRVGFA